MKIIKKTYFWEKVDRLIEMQIDVMPNFRPGWHMFLFFVFFLPYLALTMPVDFIKWIFLEQ